MPSHLDNAAQCVGVQACLDEAVRRAGVMRRADAGGDPISAAVARRSLQTYLSKAETTARMVPDQAKQAALLAQVRSVSAGLAGCCCSGGGVSGLGSLGIPVPSKFLLGLGALGAAYWLLLK